MLVMPKSLFLTSLLLCLFLTGTALASEPRASYSDYFSFIGQDESGYLLFALASNRRKSADIYQAEHFGVLYAQGQGWVDLVGAGEYANPQGILARIPDSDAFQFSGQPANGVSITSRVNDLRLEINPLTTRLEANSGARRQSWKNAAAVLYWQGRTIPGRMIYEGLTFHNRNPVSRHHADSQDNFQGFSLVIQDGPPAAWQDLYLWTEGKKGHLRSSGFIAAGARHADIFSPDLEITNRSWALGFYRWGKGWRMSLQQPATDQGIEPPFARLQLKQVSRENIANWVSGGFAMSVVEGTVEQNGRQHRVLGLVELIK